MMEAAKSAEATNVLPKPALYVVATPIGNLGDISRRAAQVLEQADLVAAEDTRHSARLLLHLGVTTRMISYHDFSSERREEVLLQKLQEGMAIALISDAGTPLISDPGFELVRRCRQAGVPVIPVPGPCALIAALSASGLPSDRFVFEGFPPARSGARKSVFNALVAESRTLVFYESPHRISESVQDMAEVFGGERQAVICRELTKTWETIKEGSLADLNEWLLAADNNRRGEFVVLVHGAEVASDQEISVEAERVLAVLTRELPLKQAAALASEITGVKKNQLYKRALALQG